MSALGQKQPLSVSPGDRLLSGVKRTLTGYQASDYLRPEADVLPQIGRTPGIQRLGANRRLHINANDRQILLTADPSSPRGHETQQGAIGFHVRTLHAVVASSSGNQC